MKQNVNFGKGLSASQIEAFQIAQAGKPVSNPMALANPKGGTIQSLEDLKPDKKGKTAGDAAYNRYWKAVYRDAVYGTAGGNFLRSFGVRQTAREVVDLACEHRKAGAA